MNLRGLPGAAPADDAAEVQVMIDRAAAAGGGVVQLDRRTYRLQRTVTARGARNVKVVGGRFMAEGDFPAVVFADCQDCEIAPDSCEAPR